MEPQQWYIGGGAIAVTGLLGFLLTKLTTTWKELNAIKHQKELDRIKITELEQEISRSNIKFQNETRIAQELAGIQVEQARMQEFKDIYQKQLDGAFKQIGLIEARYEDKLKQSFVAHDECREETAKLKAKIASQEEEIIQLQKQNQEQESRIQEIEKLKGSLYG